MRYDCSDAQSRGEGLEAAEAALARGDLAVIPTDTVYGLAADAFSADAVQRLLDAKGRGRTMPPPVLIGDASTVEALVDELPGWLRTMTSQLWPGPLTVICRQQPSLMWDLGETRQTVALRMPDDDVALELLRRTGPLAVSSANLSGQPAAQNIDDAERMLGDSVAVYLDGGDSTGGVASTIVDVTGRTARVVRDGPIELDRLREFNNTIEGGTPGA